MDNYLNSIQDIPFLRIKYVKVVRIKKGFYKIELLTVDEKKEMKSLPCPKTRPVEYARRVNSIPRATLRYLKKGGFWNIDRVYPKNFSSWAEANYIAQRLANYIKKLQDEEKQEKGYFPNNVYKVEDF